MVKRHHSWVIAGDKLLNSCASFTSECGYTRSDPFLLQVVFHYDEHINPGPEMPL